MINHELFPDATTVVELKPTPENRTQIAAIVGQVKPDWSNALMMGHPVYIIDGVTIRGYTPVMNAITGSVKTEDREGIECIVCKPTDFPIPEGHAWHKPAKTGKANNS